jgi:hypothetical protein
VLNRALIICGLASLANAQQRAELPRQILQICDCDQVQVNEERETLVEELAKRGQRNGREIRLTSASTENDQGECFCVVISPPVTPSVPVAIDTEKLEAEAFGIWSLLTGEGRKAELQRSIAKTLAAKAASPSYLNFQREVARQTLRDFVAKWLITQQQWKDAASYPIQVYFADEPIQRLKSVPQPFVGAL